MGLETLTNKMFIEVMMIHLIKYFSMFPSVRVKDLTNETEKMSTLQVH